MEEGEQRSEIIYELSSQETCKVIRQSNVNGLWQGRGIALKYSPGKRHVSHHLSGTQNERRVNFFPKALR